MKDEWEKFEETKKIKNTSFLTIATVIAIIVMGSALITWLYLRNQHDTNTDVQQTTNLETSEESMNTEKTSSDSSSLEPEQSEKNDLDQFMELIPSGLLEDYLNHSSKQYNVKMFRQGIKYIFEGSFLTELNKAESWEKWDEQKKLMISLGRKVLSDPENLKKVYMMNKLVMVAGIKGVKKEGSVMKSLKHASLIFSKKLSEKELALFENYYSVDTLLYNELNSHTYDKNKIIQLTNQLDELLQNLRKRKFNEDSIYFYEFSKRRYNEGGQELINGYVYIFNDLMDSLK